MRAELVCEKALAEYSGKLGIGTALLLGKGEERGWEMQGWLVGTGVEASKAGMGVPG